MEIESNNNTLVPDLKKECSAVKRSATVTEEDNVANCKRLKQIEPKGNRASAQKDSVAIPQRPPAQSPKRRIQVDNNVTAGGSSKPKPKRDEPFTYGNYRHYYGKRILDKDFHDIRLDVLATQPALFRDKHVLDIGCNSGHFSLEVAKKFEVKSLTGLDIDRALVNNALVAVNTLKRNCNISAAAAGGRFPYNIRFVHGNYVLADDVLLEIERAQFDVILCLSVTKWIHLNFGDAGLKQAFRRMYLQLRPGGKLVLEPQSFDTYKRRKNLSDTIKENYKSIQFKPDEFTAYLLSPAVGFSHMDLMGVPEHCKAGFKRPIQIFSKDSSQ